MSRERPLDSRQLLSISEFPSREGVSLDVLKERYPLTAEAPYQDLAHNYSTNLTILLVFSPIVRLDRLFEEYTSN
jgi:hypothetical protein